MTLHRQIPCASKRKPRAVALVALSVCALAYVVAMCAVSFAYAAGSSAETEIGVMFIEEPQANEQSDDPSEVDPNQGGQQGQTSLPQKEASGGLLAGGKGESYWLQITGDVVGRASGVFALIAVASALACLVAARRIGKEARHVR